jgi:hypothetical protein
VLFVSYKLDAKVVPSFQQSQFRDLPATFIGSSKMEDLPDELHLMILSFLEPEVWRATKFSNYRLVSRRFAHIGGQYMFETFQFRPTKAAKERMETIVQAGLARWIKVLDCGGKLDDKPEDTNENVFKEIVTGFSTAGSPIQHLAAQNMSASTFQADDMPLSIRTKLIELDLHIRATSGGPPEVNMPSFSAIVESLTQLEELYLIFGHGNDWWGWSRAPRIWDLLPLEPFKWEKLRMISLHHLSVTSDAVVGLLQAHSVTLCWFQFQGFHMLQPDGTEDMDEDVDRPREWCEKAWRSVFAQIGKMEKLLHGEIYQGDAFSVKGWKVPVDCDGRKVVIKTDLVKWLEGGKEAYEQLEGLE